MIRKWLAEMQVSQKVSTLQNKTKQKQNLFHPIVEHRATDQARLLNLSLTGAPYRSAHRGRPLLIP